MGLHDTPPIQLDDFWPYQVVVLADRISRLTLSVAKAEGGLNLSQWRVLAAIAEKPGRSAAEVVAITPMDKTIISRAIASLIDMNMVSRTADTKDRRRASVALTIEGERVYNAIATILKNSFDSTNKPSPDFMTNIRQCIVALEQAS